MAQCVRCGDETQLYIDDRPICIPCSDRLEAEAEKKAAGRQSMGQAETKTADSLFTLG